jgi:hypothetical protein
MNFEPLQTFRQEIHQLLTKAKDTTFELMDAVMTTRHASSLAEFSLNPMFRRRYPSTYEALEDSRPQRNQSMKLLISKIPIQKYITLAITSGRLRQRSYALAEARSQNPKRPDL